jgi:hypothetical protein
MFKRLIDRGFVVDVKVDVRWTEDEREQRSSDLKATGSSVFDEKSCCVK